MANQLNILIPVGTAIIKVAAVKYALVKELKKKSLIFISVIQSGRMLSLSFLGKEGLKVLWVLLSGNLRLLPVCKGVLTGEDIAVDEVPGASTGDSVADASTGDLVAGASTGDLVADASTGDLIAGASIGPVPPNPEVLLLPSLPDEFSVSLSLFCLPFNFFFNLFKLPFISNNPKSE